MRLSPVGSGWNAWRTDGVEAVCVDCERAAAVTGMGMLTCAGPTVGHNWRCVLSGRSAIGPVTSFSTERYRIRRGGEVDRRSLPGRDQPVVEFATAAAAEALADAGLPGEGQIALIVGTNMGAIGSLEANRRGGGLDRDSARRAALDYLTDRLARELALTGPVLTVSAACASAACAIGTALDLLRAGFADVVLAGGADELTEFKFSGHHQVGSMTADEIRPFDRTRSGMLLGEGAAFMVLEKAERARARGARIHAWLCGYGASNDAHHLTAGDHTGSGAALAISRALADAGTTGDAVGYVNAHGTATRYNDVMEASALEIVFGQRAWTIPCSSQKAVFGHLLGAAPAAEAIITVLTLAHGVLPPTLNHREADCECPVDCVPSTARPAAVEVAISNSFAFGGVNTCLVFRRQS